MDSSLLRARGRSKTCEPGEVKHVICPAHFLVTLMVITVNTTVVEPGSSTHAALSWRLSVLALMRNPSLEISNSGRNI